MGGGLRARRGRTSRVRQGGVAGGGLGLAPLYLPGLGRVAPVVTENKEGAVPTRPGFRSRFRDGRCCFGGLCCELIFHWVFLLRIEEQFVK